jgi:hypothetical protein
MGDKGQLRRHLVGDPKLVIVRRGHFATFELLSRTFSEDPDVQIVWDRRKEERRRSAYGPGDSERRSNGDRRRPPPMQWGQLNYMIASDAQSSSS